MDTVSFQGRTSSGICSGLVPDGVVRRRKPLIRGRLRNRWEGRWGRGSRKRGHRRCRSYNWRGGRGMCPLSNRGRVGGEFEDVGERKDCVATRSLGLPSGLMFGQKL